MQGLSGCLPHGCCDCCRQMDFRWPVNLAAASPCEGASLAVMVGDHPDAVVMDLRSRTQVATLSGHLDYAFAASWHPEHAHILATGNQVSAHAGCCRCMHGSKAHAHHLPVFVSFEGDGHCTQKP
jgi:hypothetical protein